MTTCGVDDFAVALTGIIEKTNSEIRAGLPGAVQKAARKGRRVARQAAAGAGLHEGKTYGRYISGFRQHMTSGGDAPSAEIGNRVAGLVHLLEKGHARVGGGRTRAFPHMIDGKAAADEELWDSVNDVVDRAL